MSELCSVGEKNTYEILVGKPEGKRRFGIHGRIWEENIKKKFNINFVWFWTGTSSVCVCSWQ